MSPVTPDVANLVDAGALLDAVVEASTGHAGLVAAVGDGHRRVDLVDHRADAVASVLNRYLTAKKTHLMCRIRILNNDTNTS